LNPGLFNDNVLTVLTARHQVRYVIIMNNGAGEDVKGSALYNHFPGSTEEKQGDL
jgi:hypothetical protein